MSTEVAPAMEISAKVPPTKSFELLNVIVEKVTGTVKWFSTLRCYGFIQRDDNKEDVFVHRTAITASRQRFPTLKSGEMVEFSVVETTGGINAASVTGPNGKPVKGSRSFVPRQPRLINKEGIKRDVEDGVNDDPHPHINGAGGDIEGTRRNGNFRGRGRRVFSDKRPARPMHNGMGDQSDRPETGDQREDGISPTGGVPRPRNRRGGRGGRRGGAPGRENGADRVTTVYHQSEAGEYPQKHEENGLTHVNGDSRPPRRGGRFRRGNRRRSGSNRYNKSESESVSAVAADHDHQILASNSDLPLEDHLEKMKISDNTNMVDEECKSTTEHVKPYAPNSEENVALSTETEETKTMEDAPEAEEMRVDKEVDAEEEKEEEEVTEDKPEVTSKSSN